jgi:glucose-6-phosphate 1-dehydrogenase
MPDGTDRGGFCDLSGAALSPEAAAIVVFGATGDLARRKIVPALHGLSLAGILPEETRVIGFARSALSDAEFRSALRESLERGARDAPGAGSAWERLERRITYLQGDLDDPGAYARLAARLGEGGMPENALFYLAVSPDKFEVAARNLSAAGLGSPGRAGAVGGAPRLPRPAGFRRLVVEKPFGGDRASARSLNRALQECFAESDILRIDHYLGKETVQNLLYFRFANSIFEPLWNSSHVESVEIEVLETGGIGTRGGYYDKAGAARDMLQNHLVQLLCLTAMEPPASLDAEAIRDEKVKVLRSIRDYPREELLLRSRRGQYSAGVLADGSRRAAYRDEPKVAPGSTTETYVSLALEVDNWRFAGVPFVLRTGKALDRQASEIRIRFRRPPAALFSKFCGDTLSPNALSIRIQPDEGMALRFNAKVPGAARLGASELRFAYREANAAYFPEAYERLLADALAGDSTLFIRADEAEEAWRIVDALESAWAGGPPPEPYPAGSAGPADAGPEAWGI